MSRRRPLRRNARRQICLCEPLERRRLLANTLVVNDTAAVDTITVGVTPAGGIRININGTQTDYAPGQWDSLQVQDGAGGADTINVQATVVPTIVHYVTTNVATINVGDASGVQDVKATLNMNGVRGGPAIDGSANITVDDTGDTAPRTVSMDTSGDQERITGLAPAEISIGVVIHPVSPLPVEPSSDTLTLITGSAADALSIAGLRGGLPTSIFNNNGTDAINVGAGSLARIYSNIVVAGRPNSSFQVNGSTVLTLDDSKDAQAAQFTVSAIYPPGPGPYVNIDIQGVAIPASRVSYKVLEVRSTIINGGSGGNAFTIQDLPGQVNDSFPPTLTLNAGGGNDNIFANHTQQGTLLVVNGQDGDDMLKAGPIGPFATQGVNGVLTFDGGAGVNSLTIQGPQSTPFDIPSFPVTLTAGLAQHNGVAFSYAKIDKLQIQNGAFEINGDLGPIGLTVAAEASVISFESATAVNVNTTQNLKSLTLAQGPVTLAAGGNKILNTDALTVLTGTLDLMDNRMLVHYGGNADPFVSIRKAIFAHQIKSGSADARHNLGYADSADNVVPGLAAQTVLVQFALLGDANLNGKVDFNDLVLLAQHYGAANANWDQGDFNYDGLVNFNDLAILAQNYTPAGAFPVSGAAVTAAALPSASTSTRRPTVVHKPRNRPRN
jgi:hypothetical protein